MTLKKLTSAVLATLMTLSVLTSCGSTAKKSDSSSDAKSDSSAESAAVSETAMPADDFVTKTDGTAKITIEDTKFMADGKELWFNGVNAPWNAWNDFGGGAFSFEFWQDHFSKLHDAGVNAARVWISCNGDVGMVITEDGSFSGANTQFWDDLDDFFLLAEQYHIYIMATVQSFDHFKDTNQNYEAWRTLIQDDTKTDEYIDNFIVPLVQRYGKSDYFWSVDLCNEPDWIVENAECGTLDWSYLQSYYAKACAAIHANSDVMVTVGMGMIKYNSDENGNMGNKISDTALQESLGDSTKYDKSLAYVDYYSTHWYPWMTSMWGKPFTVTPADFGLDTTKPCLIGECPATDEQTKFDVEQAYEDAYNNGWSGVFAWKSSGSDDGCGLWADIEPAIKKMMTICSDKIFPLNDQNNL